MRVRADPINPTVGDLTGNAALIIDRITAADAHGADVVVFPECALTGYPPRDLLREPAFLAAVRESIEALAESTAGLGVTAIVGTPWGEPEHIAAGGLARNSAVVIHDGAVTHRYDKRLLPTYDVFDEARYFEPGDSPLVVDVAGRRVGVLVCEDLWRGDDAGTNARYSGKADPVRETVEAGADTLAVLSASPFLLGKARAQSALLTGRARDAGCAVVAVNQCGGDDDLIFDGHAAVIELDGSGTPRVLAVSGPFNDHAITATLGEHAPAHPPHSHDPFEARTTEHLLWDALVAGTRDYARKCGFSRACLGLSGGIDSALTAAIAAAALGSDNVLGVLMPSKHSSVHSITDAEALAGNLGLATATAPIKDGHDALGEVLSDALGAVGHPGVSGITDENIQSRLRGLIMMGVSNATGDLLLTTGNKSEHAVGYATLYGDMNGGLAPIADVLKTEVYALCNWLNAHPREAGFDTDPCDDGAVIPTNTITKPPSAALRPDQTDQDSLPDYDTLDAIIAAYVDEKLDAPAIATRIGRDEGFVNEVLRMIDFAEFKRFQLCVALKVRPIAFGPGRRRPIAQGWTKDRAL